MKRLVLGVLLLCLVVALGTWGYVLTLPQHLLQVCSLKVEHVTVSPSLSHWKVQGLDLGDLGQVEHVELKFSWIRLLTLREIDSIRVHGARIFPNRTPTLSQGNPWWGPLKIRTLTLSQSSLMLDNLAEGIPVLPLTVAETPPALVWENLYIGASGTQHQDVAQSATIQNFTLYSPYDPSSPIFHFEEIFVRFTWRGIQEKRIEQVHLQQPTVFVGSDLFWFIERLGAGSQPSSNQDSWIVEKFSLADGQLHVSAFGQPALPLPGAFHVEPVRLDFSNPKAMQLSVKFITRADELNYPEYGLSLRGVKGDMSFNLPLEEQRAHDNLVRTFIFDTVRFKGLEFGTEESPAWLSITFDPTGIYGMFGTPVYSGYVNGGIAIDLNNQFEWLAWASAQGTELQPITQALSSQHIVLSGRLKGSIKAHGQRREIHGVGGKLELMDEGVLHLPALDQVPLPADWSPLKQQLAQIPLDAFRRYDYTLGKLEFAYAPPQSFLRLQLDGLQGGRNFDIRWQDERIQPQPLQLGN